MGINICLQFLTFGFPFTNIHMHSDPSPYFYAAAPIAWHVASSDVTLNEESAVDNEFFVAITSIALMTLALNVEGAVCRRKLLSHAQFGPKFYYNSYSVCCDTYTSLSPSTSYILIAANVYLRRPLTSFLALPHSIFYVLHSFHFASLRSCNLTQLPIVLMS